MATLNELIRVCEACVLQQPRGADPEAVAVGPSCTDSGQVAPGDVYWAVRRAGCDETHQCSEAFGHGAVAAVVPQPIAAPPHCWVLQVPDTRQALRRWAQWRRGHFSGTLIVVAGGVGRTTARQMIHMVLGSRLRGTSQSIGHDACCDVAAGLSALEPHHDYALLELENISCGQVAALASLGAPKVTVITPAAHYGTAECGSRQQGIGRQTASACGDLLAAMPPDGRAVLADDPWLRPIARRSAAPVTWVGTTDSCDLVAEDLRAAAGQLLFTVGGVSYRIPAWGKHHAIAALCAIAVGRTLGMDFSAIAVALEQYRSVPQACKVIELRGATIISDPRRVDSLSIAEMLELLRHLDTPGRRILVCGDLAEPDARWPASHWRLGRQAVEIAGVDLLIACGQFARHIAAGARAAGLQRSKTIACRGAAQALPYLGQATQPGDVVLIAGPGLLDTERLAEALGAYPLRRTA